MSSRRAPVEIGAAFQVVRALGGGALALAATALTIWSGHTGAAYMVVPTSVVCGHAITRIRAPGRLFGSLVLDASLVGISFLLVGWPNLALASLLAYFVIASILLLPVRQAVVVMAYTALWLVPITLWSPLAVAPAGGTPAVGTPADTLNWVQIGVPLAVLAGLVLIVARSVRGGRAQQVDAVRVEREAGRLKDQFVSMVSHELRTPLTSIAGFVETLQAGWRDTEPEEIDEFLRIVQTETEHLSALVEDVLVIPRIEAGALPLHPEDFELRPMVAHILNVLTTDERVASGVEIPSGVVVHADPTRFQQVVRNIIENAIKYGGDQILIEGRFSGTHYDLIVADNGPGVAEADRERIFEHFEQLTDDTPTSTGIGLGLPIARRLARAMDGDIWYEQRFPTGARFCFSVPVAESARQSPTMADRASPIMDTDAA